MTPMKFDTSFDNSIFSAIVSKSFILFDLLTEGFNMTDRTS